MAAFLLRSRAMLESPPVYERPGYSTLIGRIRNNVRTYIRKQIELPKQEIAEIVKANLSAVKWFGIALAFVFLTLIAFAVFIIGLLAIWLPLWAASLVALALFGGLTAFFGWGGYKRLELRGPTRSIQSLKETVRWAKARVLGRNAS
jgi:ABC-type multidrug transport system fused ATPase/permease subunit